MSILRRASALSAVVILLLAAAGATPRGVEPVQDVTRISWSWIGPENISGRIHALAIHPTNPSIIFAGSAGMWKSTNAGASWTPVDSVPATVFVSQIVFDPASPLTMYAGTGEWETQQDGIGILKSTDGGATWASVSATGKARPVHALAISADGHVLLSGGDPTSPTGTDGLFRSSDGGATWTAVTFPPNISVSYVIDIAFLAGSSTDAVASAFYGCWKCDDTFHSSDGGLNWTSAIGPTSGAGGADTTFAVSASSPNIVYALNYDTPIKSFEPPAGWSLWKSVDGGRTYGYVSVRRDVSTPNVRLWVDPTDPAHLIMGADDLWRSTDGGLTWTRISTWQLAPNSVGRIAAAIVSDPAVPRRVYFGTRAGVYKADDVGTVTSGSGGGFTALNEGLGNLSIDAAAGGLSSGTIVAVARHSGTLIRTAAGAWSVAGGGPDIASPYFPWHAAADGDDPNFLYSADALPHVYRNASGGAGTFERIDGTASDGSCKPAPYRIDELCGSVFERFSGLMVLDPTDPRRMYVARSQLWRTSDARAANTATTGPAWTSLSEPWSAYFRISAIAVAPGQPDVVWMGYYWNKFYNPAGIRVTRNATATTPTWRTGNWGDDYGIPLSIAVAPGQPDVAYVAVSSGPARVRKTVDGGASWTVASTGLPSGAIPSIVVHPYRPSLLYAATEQGVFHSDDGGGTWAAAGLTNVRVTHLSWLGTDLLASTDGRGLYRARTRHALLTVQTPAERTTVTQPFSFEGWALDQASSIGTGIDAVHVWAHPSGGGPPLFVGAAELGGTRTELTPIFGSQFEPSGFAVAVRGLPPDTYQFVAYGHSTVTGDWAVERSASMTVAAPAPRPYITIETPADGAVVGGSFLVAGWALDLGTPLDTGIDAVHVWAYPLAGASPLTFIGAAESGWPRPDVGAAFGSVYTNSGYGLIASGLAPGPWRLAVFGRSTVSGLFYPQVRDITVRPPGLPRMWVETPADGSRVSQPFVIAGWAVDLDAPSGTGVDTLQVWAVPPSGDPIFAGVATIGGMRPDVGAVFGEAFAASGYGLRVSALPPGPYQIVVYAHSTVTGTFNQARVVSLTVER